MKWKVYGRHVTICGKQMETEDVPPPRIKIQHMRGIMSWPKFESIYDQRNEVKHRPTLFGAFFLVLFAMWQDLTNNPNRVIDTAKVEAGNQKPRADDLNFQGRFKLYKLSFN